MKQCYRWRSLALGWLLLISLASCAVEDRQAAAPASSTPRSTLGPTATPPRPTPTFVPVNGGGAPGGTVAAGAGQVLRLDDDVWQGSYRRSGRPTIYGGRSATWIYGTGTEYSTMQAQFEVTGQPVGTAELRVEGMDSEGPAKTLIQITINDQPIFSGSNPLPDDDQPLETGTWATVSWPFAASLLRPGSNVVRIANLSPGQFSRPPFFMLDYAEISYQTQ